MKMVKLFGFDECPYCKQLKELYDGNNIDYTYVDVNDPKNGKISEAVFRIAKSDAVPIVIVGKKMLVPEVSFFNIHQALAKTKKFMNA